MVLVISHNGSQTLVFYFSAASLIPPPGLLAFEREMSAPAVRKDNITSSPAVPIEVCTCISLYTENIHQPKSSQFFTNAELKKSQVAKIKEANLLDTGESRNFLLPVANVSGCYFCVHRYVMLHVLSLFH